MRQQLPLKVIVKGVPVSAVMDLEELDRDVIL
jgi:hypothetical protein